MKQECFPLTLLKLKGGISPALYYSHIHLKFSISKKKKKSINVINFRRKDRTKEEKEGGRETKKHFKTFIGTYRIQGREEFLEDKRQKAA